jgi:hypothetical protein
MPVVDNGQPSASRIDKKENGYNTFNATPKF